MASQHKLICELIIWKDKMCVEELFQINQRIGMIKRNLQIRQERAAQWSVPFQKVLEKKQDPDAYLSKACKLHSLKKHKTSNSDFQGDLSEKVRATRNKINNHYNELKQLDDLLKKKNRIRAIALQQENVNEQKVQEQKSLSNDNQKTTAQNCINYENRSLKERSNPFNTLRVQKLIQYHQENKNKQNDDYLTSKILGIGLKNTPLSFLKEEKQVSMQPEQQQKRTKQNTTYVKLPKNISRVIKAKFESKNHIYGATHQKTNIFQDKLTRIIKCHGNFWRNSFQH